MRGSRQKVKVFGVGGAGCNFMRNMTNDFKAVFEVWAVNTDRKSLECSRVMNRIKLGGLVRGSQGDPVIGRKLAEEAKEEFETILKGTKVVLMVADLGGGTGSGVTPVINKIAKHLGIKTACVFTIPFIHEGPMRKKQAENTLDELRPNVDGLTVIPNETINEMNTKTLEGAFSVIDGLVEIEVKRMVSILN